MGGKVSTPKPPRLYEAPVQENSEAGGFRLVEVHLDRNGDGTAHDSYSIGFIAFATLVLAFVVRKMWLRHKKRRAEKALKAATLLQLKLAAKAAAPKSAASFPAIEQKNADVEAPPAKLPTATLMV